MTKQIHELGELFEEVQLQNILGDGKTFPDCIPKRSLEEINQDYLNQKDKANFELKKFVLDNFTLPKASATDYKSDSTKSATEHITALWDVLARTPSYSQQSQETEGKPDEAGGSIIPLPHPYIVPGGRFREIYYWDSYFTMLGLKVSGRTDLIKAMVDNFAHLIDTIGYIPNGNRTYYLGRSQPPFFSLMVKLLSELKKDVLKEYLPHLEREYAFWMRSENLSDKHNAQHRVVQLPDGSLLNRYWDENVTARPESFKEDVELARHTLQKPEILYRNIRAAAESGWDFSSRWFRDEHSFATIHTTEIIPVDLNCLLYYLEVILADAFRESGNNPEALKYQQQSLARKEAIIKYCWNEEQGFFFDYDFVAQKQKQSFTLASAFPLFFKVATNDQAKAVGNVLREKFLKPGGLTTTLLHSGQQWDAPNGWAPLQWIAYRGLLNYRLEDLANQLKANWVNVNLKVYANSGKMTEKYDVWSKDGEASGGEYPNQDGFGWTNGVFLAMASH
ncbi:MAG: alpha,alpha-trehalase TreF [Cyclobacteriaceae bacterium]